jgi:hypothetical protein
VASTKDLIKVSDSGNVVELSDVLVDRRIQARTLSQSAEGRRVLKKLLNDVRSSEPSRIESLWALANVPLAVDSLKLVRDGQQPANFLQRADHVSIAAAEILNSPQLAPKVPASEEILPEKLLNLEEDWGRYFAAQVVEYLSKNMACFELTEFSTLKDPFINALVLKKQKQTFDSRLIKALPPLMECQPGRVRPEVVLSFLLARAMNPKDIETARVGLLFKSLAVKRAVVQWIGEEQLKELRSDVEKVLSSEPMNGELFMACLATLSLLDGVPHPKYCVPLGAVELGCQP